MTEPTTSSFRNLDDLSPRLAKAPPEGRRVFVRADLNVPLRETHQGMVVTDEFKIHSILPTLRELTGAGARVILASHLGRPDEKEGAKPGTALSLAPVAHCLSILLGAPVAFVPAVTGPEVDKAVATLPPGGVLLLENLRFEAGEAKNDPAFAQALAGLADFYVNDAFATAHRAHASVAQLPALLPGFAGRLLTHELDALTAALMHPATPVLAIIGGAKISSKLALIENIMGRADRLFVGGAMANTLLAAEGVDVRQSLYEPALIPTANRILLAARTGNRCDLMLPLDALATDPFHPDGLPVPCLALPVDGKIVDIGPATILRLEAAIAEARTIIWNGPVGMFEDPRFASGTRAVAKMLAARVAEGAVVVAGGGDTVAALADAGVDKALTHVSTGPFR